MDHAHTPARRGLPWRTLLGFLCLGLVLLCGTLTATHVHPQGDVSHADCSLCMAAHAFAHPAAQPAQIVAPHRVTRVAAPAPIERPRTLPRSALFTRPPPQNAGRS